MPQSDLCITPARKPRKRARTPSPREESRPPKRQRHFQQSHCSPSITVDSPQSAASAASIGQYYGLGDEDALGNLFASYPRSFTTVPHPHGSQVLHEPWWELRFDHEIYLSNDFLPALPRSQRVRNPIPGPETDPFASDSPPQSAPIPPSATGFEFKSALELAREIIGEGRTLTTELARSYERVRQWRERWGWSPLTSDAYESPPPYSPPRVLRLRPSTRSPEASSATPLASHSQYQQSQSPTPDPIPNPSIPGDPAPSAEVLFDTVNAFAKAHGFGIFDGTATHIKAGRSDIHSSATDSESLDLLKARGSGNVDPVSVVVGGWSLPRQRKRASGFCESTQTLNTASTRPQHRTISASFP